MYLPRITRVLTWFKFSDTVFKFMMFSIFVCIILQFILLLIFNYLLYNKVTDHILLIAIMKFQGKTVNQQPQKRSDAKEINKKKEVQITPIERKVNTTFI